MTLVRFSVEGRTIIPQEGSRRLRLLLCFLILLHTQVNHPHKHTHTHIQADTHTHTHRRASNSYPSPAQRWIHRSAPHQLRGSSRGGSVSSCHNSHPSQ